MKSLKISSDYNTMINGAVNAGVSYLRDNPNIKTLVLGISGGVDSAVVAAIARKVCDVLSAEGRKICLDGYCLQILGNKTDEIKRALAVGEAFCHDFSIHRFLVNLSGTVMNLLNGIDYSLFQKYTERNDTLTHGDKVRLGNMKARTRMAFLYNKAQEQKGLVLSTDNLTEYFLGFWTLHGDVGDLGLIQELWKTEVFGMAELLGGPVFDCANAIPTDGLGITNSDIDQLLPDWKPEAGDHKVAYNAVDRILIDHLDGIGTYSSKNPVIQRYEATKFKRENPVNIKREMLLWVHNSIM